MKLREILKIVKEEDTLIKSIYDEELHPFKRCGKEILDSEVVSITPSTYEDIYVYIDDKKQYLERVSEQIGEKVVIEGRNNE